MDIVIIGSGHAGQSFLRALRSVGHTVSMVHHEQAPSVKADVIVLAVPDAAIAQVAEQIPAGAGVVVHLCGSRGLSELESHQRVGYMHPLAALVSPEIGAARLIGATYSVAGDQLVFDLVASLRGRVIEISDPLRARYHAAAAVAANHTVALMAHLEELAVTAGLSLEEYLPLVRNAVDDVARAGARASLTGPASRGDSQTIDAHLAAIPTAEQAIYVALANRAFVLSDAAPVVQP
jgi:predicted short-subunit dehydrogenase-like oxidoreductase (DUF2520 family)